MEHNLYVFLVGACACLAGEIFKVYELRGKLGSKRYKQMARSWEFWLVELAMILATGFVAWLINYQATEATPWQIAASGLAGRAVFRAPTEARVANRGTQLGESDFRVTDLFR